MADKRVMIPVTAAALLAAFLTAVLMPEPAAAAPEPRAVAARYVTVPPASFHASIKGLHHENTGDELWVATPSTSGSFLAPLFFEDPRVRITNLVLYAADNGPGDVCLSLHRITPSDGDGDTEDEMGRVCSTGAEAGVRAFEIDGWSHQVITGAHGPYLLVEFPGTRGDGYIFLGARVTYLYEP